MIFEHNIKVVRCVFRVQDLGFMVYSLGVGVQSLGFRVPGVGFRVLGLWFRVYCLGFRKKFECFIFGYKINAIRGVFLGKL